MIKEYFKSNNSSFSFFTISIITLVILTLSVTFVANLVFGVPSVYDLEYFYGNSTTTKLEFNNSTITLDQYTNKTTYNVGEKIYVYGSLLNIGTHDLYVAYGTPSISSELKYQNGTVADLYGGAIVLTGSGGSETLKPNTSTFLRVWAPDSSKPPYLHLIPSFLVAKESGNFTITSMTDISYSSNKTSEYNNGTITLWSKPLHITILSEKHMENKTDLSQSKIPEFPFANHLSPLKQFKSGITLDKIQCNDDLKLILKSNDNSPTCVKSDSKIKLIERGWAKSFS